MTQRIRNRRGFTLIELMIVIVILGIIAALAVPCFMEAWARSEAFKVLGQAYTAQHAYYDEHGIYAGSFDWLKVGVPEDAWCVYGTDLTESGFVVRAINHEMGIDYSIDQDSTFNKNDSSGD